LAKAAGKRGVIRLASPRLDNSMAYARRGYSDKNLLYTLQSLGMLPVLSLGTLFA
jgi:hypothetical protein